MLGSSMGYRVSWVSEEVALAFQRPAGPAAPTYHGEDGL